MEECPSPLRDRVSPAHAAAGFALVAALLWACSPAPSNRPDAEVVVARDGAPVVLKDVKNEILSMRGYTPSLEARGPPRRGFRGGPAGDRANRRPARGGSGGA